MRSYAIIALNVGSCLAACAAADGQDAASAEDALSVTKVCASIRPPPTTLGLDPFYAKYCDARGIPVAAAAVVPDAAVRQAARLTAALLEPIPRVQAIFKQRGLRVAVIGEHQAFGDIPENAPETAADPGRFAAKRADGAFSPGAAGPPNPVVSDGEENILCYERDGYARASNNLVHELAHNIKTHGLEVLDSAFHDRVKAAFDAAIAAGKYQGLYAGSSADEYWAEGVQDYFDVHGAYANDINTREDLATYDPTLFSIIDGVFGGARLPPACPTPTFAASGSSATFRIGNAGIGSGESLDSTSLLPSSHVSGQEWTLTAKRGGCFALRNRYRPALALDVTEMKPAGNRSGQCWTISPVTNGEWRLTNAYLGPGQSLAAHNGAIRMAPSADVPEQRWTVTPF